MLPKSPKLRFLLLFLPLLCIAEAITVKTLGAEFWWTGAVWAQLLYLYCKEGILRGFDLVGELGLERIKLNMTATGLKVPTLFPFHKRAILFFTALTCIFFVVIESEVQKGFEKISEILLSEDLFLKIEYPSWSNVPAFEHKLSSTQIDAVADTASYLEIKSRNQRSKYWNLSISMSQNEKFDGKGLAEPLTIKIGGQGNSRWGQSITRIYELFNMEKTKKTFIKVQTKDSFGEIYIAIIKIIPLTIPEVSLARTGLRNNKTNNNALLGFEINAASRVPFTTMEFEVRTLSGYRFSKTIAEYLGNDIKEVRNLYSELNTMGIPFVSQDKLFVKASVNTIVQGLQGVSNEIEIEVSSPQEVRQKIEEKLLEATKNLETEGNEASREWQKNALSSLQEASNLADSLGRRGIVKKHISQAVEALSKAETRKDNHVQQTKKKIKDALEYLKRAQNMAEATTLLARIQSLYNSIKRGNVSTKDLIKDTEKIIASAKKVKGELEQLLGSNISSLSPEEKKLATSLLAKDKTDKYLENSIPKLHNSHLYEASEDTLKSLNEAKLNIGGVMQLLMAARQRAIMQAKEHLANADQKLQLSRSKSPQNAVQDTKAAHQELSQITPLGQPFDEALDEAKTGTKEATENAEQENTQKLATSLDKAQDGIVKAIEALQDMEEQERSDEREREGHDERSIAELIATQGDLDAAWRKRILEEISKLRASGESSDAPELKFLESRLR